MEVIKESFEVRMTIRKLVANVKRLDRRITEIEKKQAERFPHLIERLEQLENKQNAAKYNKAAIHDRSGKRWSKR